MVVLKIDIKRLVTQPPKGNPEISTNADCPPLRFALQDHETAILQIFSSSARVAASSNSSMRTHFRRYSAPMRRLVPLAKTSSSPLWRKVPITPPICRSWGDMSTKKLSLARIASLSRSPVPGSCYPDKAKSRASRREQFRKAVGTRRARATTSARPGVVAPSRFTLQSAELIKGPPAQLTIPDAVIWNSQIIFQLFSKSYQ